MIGRDFYQVLGVPRDASPDAVRAAYVRLTRRHHPDVEGDLPERLREVQRAYRCLADPAARAGHDHAIAEAERLHLARARRVRRRLGRYDRRHPHPAPRARRRLGWPLIVSAAGIAIVAGLTATLLA